MSQPANPSSPDRRSDNGPGPQPPSDGLAITGERTVPDVADENYWFQRHVAAYTHVAGRIHGTVVDAGCGEGYGLALLLAAGARGVIGIDVDPVTVDHARRRYGSERIEVVEADLTDLPLVDDTVNVVVSIQVVEHLVEVDRYLDELVRITQPGGLVVLGTPNRLTFSPGGVPVNPFHVREFSADEVTGLMAEAGLNVTEVLGIRHGPALAAAMQEHAPDWTAVLADPATWSEELTRIVHAVTRDDFVVTADDLDTCLDLIAWGKLPR